MTEDERPPRLRAFDMLDSIAQIDRASRGLDGLSFAGNELLVCAVERWIEIVSEARRHLPAEAKAQHPSIDWKQIAGIGNVLRHGYQVIDRQILWNIVTQDLPPLRHAMEQIYSNLKLPPDPWPNVE